MRFRTTFSALAFVGLIASATAQSINLTSFPTRSVADGRSQVTLTAEVRDSNGRIVPDGTQIIFSTNLGTFRESTARTQGGIARAVLIAGGVAGIARITVKALSGNAAPTTYEYEFVANRDLLNSAQEFVEMVAPGQMQYSADSRYLSASGTDKPVFVRYRDITIEAQDVQLDTGSYVLRARKAHLKFGKINQTFDELHMRLSQRMGYGTAPVPTFSFDTVVWNGHGFTPLEQNTDGTYSPAKPRERFGIVQIRAGLVEPVVDNVDRSVFNFQDLSDTTSSIRAKKAIVFARRGIQFQKAEVYVGETRVMQMPLYELNPQAQSSPLVTDQLVSVRDSRLAVNYPHYLSLKPGQTSLLRLRTGDTYGRSTVASGGVFLDYELNWNKGDQMDGGLTFSGIGRNDWTIGVRNFWQFDSRTNAYVQLQSPFAQSIFGNFGVTRQFDGFTASLSGNAARQLRGLSYTSTDLSLNLRKDPTKVGKLPLRLDYGITAFNSTNSLVGSANRSYGLFTQLSTLPLALDRQTTFTGSAQVQALDGTKAYRGMAYFANATLARQFSNSFTVVGSYDFVKDRYEDRALGSHRAGLNGFYEAGRFNSSFQFNKSLDVDRISLYGDLSYRMGGPWRLGYSYTLDKVLGETYMDASYTLGYRVGWREVGLVYSRQTGRLGFQILGATVY